MIIDNIPINYPDDMPEGEAEAYAVNEINWWKRNYPGKPIAAINLRVIDGEVEISSGEKSPIRRIRRITGYLSEIDKFNDGKKAELNDRRTHL